MIVVIVVSFRVERSIGLKCRLSMSMSRLQIQKSKYNKPRFCWFRELPISLYPDRLKPMSGQKIPLNHQIGRRLRLRDLAVFSAVAKHQSMAKAAAELGVTQPSVSEVIAGLEHTYGVKLFDRSPRGVELTIFGQAMIKRCIAIFDEIKQSGKTLSSWPTRPLVKSGLPAWSLFRPRYCRRYCCTLGSNILTSSFMLIT